MRRWFQNSMSRRDEPRAINACGAGTPHINFGDEFFDKLPMACWRCEENGRIVAWNRAAETLYGWRRDEVMGRTIWQTVVRPQDESKMRGQVALVFSGESLRQEQWQQRCADEKSCEIAGDLFPLHHNNGEVVSAVMAGVDAGERRRAEERLTRNAFQDRLTNLPDRTLFLERVEKALRHARQQVEHEFAVFFLNIDRFKVANESLGHQAGDILLVNTARKLEACVAPTDTVARLGGDEFAILLDGLKSENDAIQIAERIQKRLALPTGIGGHEVFSTASIGITLNLPSHARAEDVLRDAQAAMERAKSGGKARYEIFDKGLPTHTRSVLALESDLRRALGRHELRLEYQPIVSLASGMIDGFEAVIRWHHATHGLIAPGRFIPLAEETGLIIPIGYWALSEACNQLATWQKGQRPRALPVTVSVNLSARQFTQRNLLEQILSIITQSGADPRYLKLEITESAIMDNTDSAIEMLTHLKEIGIKISLDDFGTGYSSLSYLHKFPFNTLKIDQSFVSQMDVSVKNEKIVRAIVALGHSLNMDVIAEGVENDKQLAHLRGLKCHYGQGYFFGGAMDAKLAGEFVSANPQW